MADKLTDAEAGRIVKHWVENSEEDFETMMKLYNSKSYRWALFLGHISVERLLKALYVKTQRQHAPYTHNLYRLAESCGIKISEEYSSWLFQITSFNINARYNDYKREFYNLCTQEFTTEWIEKISSIRQWIKQLL